jgi:hypothetical protein
VNLATLDRRIASKRAADRLGQRLRAIDDEQTSHSWIKSTLDEIVDERLHGRHIFGRALDEAERMFVAVRVDATVAIASLPVTEMMVRRSSRCT